MNKKIILASSSPRRKNILKKLGIKFKAIKNNYEEDMTLNLPPEKLAKYLSRGKAESISKENPNCIIIGADTFIVFKDRYIGKPKNSKDAIKMLQDFSGNFHKVITGFTILDTSNNKLVSKSVETKVFFRDLTIKEIKDYVRISKPLDKAGAYGIQELGSVFIEKIEGDYYNVMGLPICELISTLKEGFSIDLIELNNL